MRTLRQILPVAALGLLAACAGTPNGGDTRVATERVCEERPAGTTSRVRRKICRDVARPEDAGE